MTNKLTGGNTNYYLASVKKPKRLAPYEAECEDIIRVLKMTFSEGCSFKALWRSAAARLGNGKPGADPHGIYDGEKIKHYGERILDERQQDYEAEVGARPEKSVGDWPVLNPPGAVPKDPSFGPGGVPSSYNLPSDNEIWGSEAPPPMPHPSKRG